MGYFAGDQLDQGRLGEMNDALSGLLIDVAARGDLSGDWLQATVLFPQSEIAARRVVLVGLGEAAKFTPSRAREFAATAVRQAVKRKAESLSLVLPAKAVSELGTAAWGHAAAEGLLLADYHFDGYAKGRESVHHVTRATVWSTVDDAANVEQGIAAGCAFAEGTRFARDLVNTPGNLLPPRVLAQRAVELAQRYSLACEVLDKADMERLGMGGLLAVNQGSVEPPRLISIRYMGDPESREIIALVGKGITFDSGGISLKPADGMDRMKTDMAGAAAVLGAMETIARLRPQVNVMVVVPSTENMPSGSAYRPGDVLTTMSGKTIEVLNTDAEGRVVLADALAYARNSGATKLVDVATLTGACVVALGNVTSGVITNDDAWLDQFVSAAESAGERVWALPAFEEYEAQIKSDVADVANTGGRPAGAITAGLFLKAFVEDIPWIHVDIAGTAWSDRERPLTNKGATGVMVRTLAALAVACAPNAQ